MLIWFLTIALLVSLLSFTAPMCSWPCRPFTDTCFSFITIGKVFMVLGSVFLVVTGGEALYADMGHFSLRTIRLAWFGLVLPSLLLNYFGQGALLLTNPKEVFHPFYHLAPGWALYPLVILATRSHCHCLSGGDLGSFLPVPPGSVSRAVAETEDCPNLFNANRPNIHSQH